MGIAEGDNREIKFFSTIAGGLGVGAGGGVSISGGTSFLEGIDDPDDLAGWGNSISINLIGGISESFSAEFSRKSGGFSVSGGIGGLASGTVTYQLGYTIVGKSVLDVLNKLPISNKNKEKLRTEFEKRKNKYKKGEGKWK